MRITVKNLLPNPFRHLDRYPIRQDKVEALKASIASTEFWGTTSLPARREPMASTNLLTDTTD